MEIGRAVDFEFLVMWARLEVELVLVVHCLNCNNGQFK